MTCAQIIAEHCLATSGDMPVERRIVLLRALAIEIADEPMATTCREIANQLEAAEHDQRQLLLNLRARRAA